jgi:hypothetical protein
VITFRRKPKPLQAHAEASLRMSAGSDWLTLAAQWTGPEDARPLIVPVTLDYAFTSLDVELRPQLLDCFVDIVDELKRANQADLEPVNLDEYACTITDDLDVPQFTQRIWTGAENPTIQTVTSLTGSSTGRATVGFEPHFSDSNTNKIQLALATWDWFVGSRSTTTSQLLLGAMLTGTVAVIHSELLDTGTVLGGNDRGKVIDQAMQMAADSGLF